MPNKDLKKYFEKIKLEELSLNELPSHEKINYLFKIYFAHVTTFPYQNFKLRKISQQHPVQRQALNLYSFWKLLSEDRGGYCYLIAMLLFTVLKEKGYDVVRCSARVLNGLSVNSKELLAIPPTHMILVVSIDDQKFFLDPGLGARAPRLPIPIKETPEIFKLQHDQFKFHVVDGVYVLEKLQDQKWIQLIQTDLKALEDKAVKNRLLKLERCPSIIGIRDSKTVAGIITETGYKSFFWDITSNEYIFAEEKNGKYDKQVLANHKEAYLKLKHELNIKHIKITDLETYCSENPWPKPKESWTVNFPIDQKELDQMVKNLQP